jgi:hypothetical protein
MRSAPDNPKSNEIPPRLNEKELSELISKSGYPLQTVISNQLKKLSFRIEQEWTYMDSESEQVKERNLDLLASKVLWDCERKEGKPPIRPCLSLLIECKRSIESPYIFFLSGDKSLDTFPNFAGLRKSYLSIHSETEYSETEVMNFPYSTALSLHLLPFIRNKKEVCMTLSKCVKDGKLTLKGDEPYNAIVKPLIKAIKYYQEKEIPQFALSSYEYIDFHLTVGLAIIDAPMIVVRVGEKGNKLELSPWVRVNRQTSSEDEDRLRLIGDKGFSIDVIHKDYLDKYINEHLLPFALEFSKRVRKHEEELIRGESYVELKKGSTLGNDIEPLIRPK